MSLMRIKVKLEDSKYFYDDREEEYDTEFHGWDLVADFLIDNLKDYQDEFDKISIEVTK